MNLILKYLKNFPKSFSTILGATVLLTLLSMISKGIGFFREIVIANNFGISDKYDIFLVSSTIPLVLNTTAIYLGQNYFIPAYSNLVAESSDKKSIFFTSTFLFFLCIGSLITAILYISAPFLMNYYIISGNEESINLASKLLRLYAFTIPSSFGLSIISAYHQVKYNYKIPGYIQLVSNVIILAIILFFSEVFDVFVIPFAFLLGVTLQFIVLILSAKDDFKFRMNFDLLKSHRSINFLTISLIEIVAISFVFIDRYFYGSVNPGGIASLNYAQTIYLLPISIIVLSFSTVLLPKFSNSFAEGNYELLQRRFSYSIYFILLVFIPLTFLFISHSEIIITLVFQRGEFTPTATKQTSTLLRILSISFVFYAIYGILNKLMLSIKMAKQLLLIVVVSMIIKFVLNKYLVQTYFEDALAVSTVAVFVIISISAAVFISVRSKVSIQLKNLIKFILLFTFSSIISAVIVKNFDLIIYEQTIKSILQILFFIFIYMIFIYTILPNTFRKQLLSNFEFNHN